MRRISIPIMILLSSCGGSAPIDYKVINTPKLITEKLGPPSEQRTLRAEAGVIGDLVYEYQKESLKFYFKNGELIQVNKLGHVVFLRDSEIFRDSGNTFVNPTRTQDNLTP